MPSSTALMRWATQSESDLAGWKVYYGTSPGQYGSPINVGLTSSTGNPSYTVSGLLNNTTYYFAVTAYDQAGNESQFSSEVSKSISFQLTNLTRIYK